MEDKSYLRQVIDDLRQLRARRDGAGPVQELPPADCNELYDMLQDAINHVPGGFPRTAGSGSEGAKDRLSKIIDALGQQNAELSSALAAISPDFSVEKIEDAILVAEGQLSS